MMQRKIAVKQEAKTPRIQEAKKIPAGLRAVWLSSYKNIECLTRLGEKKDAVNGWESKGKFPGGDSPESPHASDTALVGAQHAVPATFRPGHSPGSAEKRRRKRRGE